MALNFFFHDAVRIQTFPDDYFSWVTALSSTTKLVMPFHLISHTR